MVLTRPKWRGSPSHMRGKAFLISAKLLNPGITPTHAGKRELLLYWLAYFGDHLRTCGEKSVKRGHFSVVLGSPPHMRGKDAYVGSTCNNLRITPAHAGKSEFLFIRLSPPKDHPRTCGEKEPYFSRLAKTKGSPPHMWGKETLW